MVRLRHHVLGAIAAALVVGGITAPEIQAQQRVLESAESTLVILARTRPDMTANRLHDDFELGLKEAVKQQACTYVDFEMPQLIPGATYEALASVLGSAARRPAVATSEDFDWRQIPTLESTWELRLPKTTQLLSELTVKYARAGDVKYTSQKKGAGDQQFRMLVPGTYAVPILGDDFPESYTVKVEELGADPKTISQKEFPKYDRYFVLRIGGFKGNQNRVLEILSDPNVIPNPILSLEPLKNYHFAFANLSDLTPSYDGLLEGQSYVARVGKIEGRAAKRVWTLFPLSKGEAEDRSKEFAGKSGADIARMIRDDKNNVPANQEALVEANSPARWFELPDTYTGMDATRRFQTFGRSIPLGNFGDLANKYPQIYRLVAWEFDNGEIQSAIEVRDPEGKRVNVLAEEIKALPGALRERIKKDDKAPAKTKP